jgi:hypothetical protein
LDRTTQPQAHPVVQSLPHPQFKPQTKPIAQNDNQNPVHTVKVDNRSDMDVCTATTNSFEDAGSLDSMATSYPA